MKIPTGDVDLNKVETGIPIIAPCDVIVKVVEMGVVPTKAGDEMIRTKMLTDDVTYTREGEKINPGFPIFARASLKTTEKYDPVKRHLVPMMDCFLGERPASGFETEDFIGKIGKIRLTIRSDDQYGESNEVKAYIPKNARH